MAFSRDSCWLLVGWLLGSPGISVGLLGWMLDEMAVDLSWNNCLLLGIDVKVDGCRPLMKWLLASLKLLVSLTWVLASSDILFPVDGS